MFLVEISAKHDKFGYLNPILGKLGVTQLVDGSLESRWSTLNFFPIYYDS